jgi:hypothetical protein
MLAPAKQNYRKLCTKLIQNCISERRGKHKMIPIRSSNTDESVPRDICLSLGQPKNGSRDVADAEESEEAPEHKVFSAVVTVATARPISSTPHSAAIRRRISLGRSDTNPSVILPRQGPNQDDCLEGHKRSYNSPRESHIPLLTSLRGSHDEGDKKCDDYKFVCVDEDGKEDSQKLNRTDSATEIYRDSVPEDEVESDDSSRASNQARSVEEEEQGSPPRDKIRPCKEGYTQNVAEFGMERTAEPTGEATKGRDSNSNDDATGTQGISASRKMMPSFSFIANIAGLDRFTNNFECSFLAGDAEDFGYSDIDDYEDSECRFQEDDSITTYDKGAYGSLGAGRSTIEEDVEDALEWADEHVLLCGRHRL